MLLFSLLIIVLLSSFGIRAYRAEKNMLLTSIDTGMYEQLDDLVHFINLEADLNQKRVDQLFNLSYSLFETKYTVTENYERQVKFEAENQITGETKPVYVNLWQSRGGRIQKKYNFVDEIQEMTGAMVTIFQKIEDGYLRISTNVVKENGERAIGTFIPNESEVVKTIEKGMRYSGRAYVVNDWYLTAYEPLKINGEIKGMLSVGVSEKNLQAIKRLYAEKVYLEEGYPYLISKDGTFIVHPTHEGKSAEGEEFFQQIINSEKERGKTYYEWEGRMKYQYFEYIDRIDAYTVATIYEDAILEKLKETRYAVIISIALGLLVSLLVIWIFSRRLSKRMEKAVGFAEAISRGDLTSDLNDSYKDEVGRLSYALNKMSDKLEEILKSIQSGAQSVLKAGEQVSEGSQELSQNASEQASSLEEISSSMEKIAANSQQNGRNAQITDQMSNKSAEGVRSGAQVVKETQTAMNAIVEKIAVINAIAKKTDLLAINAAIEAARAGEDGKGFAVVAGEIRKLAERSTEAAEIINEQSESGIEISKKAGEKFSKVVSDIEKTTVLVNKIADSTKEMSSGTNEVSTSVQKMNSVTQHTAAASEELATSAEELTTQAESLTKIVHFFKLDEDSRSTDPVSSASPETEKNNEEARQTENRENIINLESDDKDVGFGDDSDNDDDFEHY